MKGLKIICTGKIANTTVGHIDHTMAYAAGFQQLSHEVYLMEQVLFHKKEGDFEAMDRYQHLFTLGLNIGTSRCDIPTGGHRWIPALRPVVLPMWCARSNPDSKRFTTISTWKGRDTFLWKGRFSGEKSDNWLKFIELPTKTGGEFELAMKLNSSNHQADRELFRNNGWQLTDPGKLRDLDDYRSFIGRSRAEFSVTHDRCVKFSTGWFSDRSAVYLASGKPVLVQSNGIEHHLPTGKGLLTFATMEEAIGGIEEINGDYLAHCRAARAIAEGHLDSDKILTKILSQIDLV